MDNKKVLEQMYIKYPEWQQVLNNDGAFITFVERDGDIVILHQSDEMQDNFVCLTVDDLKKIQL